MTWCLLNTKQVHLKTYIQKVLKTHIFRRNSEFQYNCYFNLLDTLDSGHPHHPHQKKKKIKAPPKLQKFANAVLSKGNKTLVNLVAPGVNDLVWVALVEVLDGQAIKLYHLGCDFRCDGVLATVNHWLLQDAFLCLGLKDNCHSLKGWHKTAKLKTYSVCTKHSSDT